jgi:predicted helicase
MIFSEILKKKHSDWRSLEQEIEKLPTAYDKGEVFEQFIYAYLLLNSQLYQIQELYRSTEIPKKYLEKYKLEKKDSGVDGLIILENGKGAGYQVKFRSNRKKPSYDELAKFWVEAQHTDINYTIANSYSVTDLSKKQEKHLQILVDDFDNLDKMFFESLFTLTNRQKIKKREKYEPYDFQKEIIKDTINGFKTSNRGKVIAACGTGKTLTALWITEKIKAKNVLFLEPSLALIKQTLEAWANQSNRPFSYLAVCSDKSVSLNEEDDGDIAITDLNIPVTTEISEIINFLHSENSDTKYIFSTYQSLPVIAEAFMGIDDFEFDLTIFDEAHRTAGAKESSLFSLALDDNNIPSCKRLFMTATQRMLRPKLKKIAADNERLVFSMDDEDIYGKLFHSYNFGKAINDKIISDYEIIVAGIQESELKIWIANNKELEVLNEADNTTFTTAQTLFTQIILAKAIESYPINKVISFHSSINNAKVFSGAIGNGNNLDSLITKVNKSIDFDDLYIDHINGSMSAGNRQEKLDEFKNSKYGLISNSRCLTEGVDVPIIDSIYFVDNKNSIIDIVQACGRALRKPISTPDKTAFFIIPVLIPDDSTSSDIINMESFEMVYSVLQALRDQDDRLDEWINEINQGAVKGKFSKYKKGSKNPLKFFLPNSINIDDFADKLYLKIATVNANPTNVLYKPAIKYGKKQRKSGYKRIFKTLGDYSIESYFNSLVVPTIEKYKPSKSSITNKEAKINNNNVSHTLRLGLIVKDQKNYNITPLGKNYLDGKIDNATLFKRQMLRYSTYLEDSNDSRLLFPYRACLKIIEQTKSLNFFEFAFGVNTLYDSSNESIQEAIKSIFILREKYPNLLLVNEANRGTLLNELNELFGSEYSLTDIWTKRTTLYNQYGYFRNHLSIFSDFIEIDNQVINLISDRVTKLNQLLALDNRLEYEQDHKAILNKYVSPFLNFVIFTL